MLAQFAGTSLWFAGNAILPDIQKQLLGSGQLLANITSFVQFGFISGTLIFAILSIADRFSPSRVFFISATCAAIANLSINSFSHDLISLLFLRFCTGFFLAGVYPVGMKIAADWYEKGLGKALGYLVGALVLGTAFPYLLKAGYLQLAWQSVIMFTSVFAFAGGLLILFFIGNGPWRKPATRFQPSALLECFREKNFRAAAFGYFGHMWELYSFWAFVPVMLSIYNQLNEGKVNVPSSAFIVIAIGSLSCVAGGYISQRIGSAKVAFFSLAGSAMCCLLSPLFFFTGEVMFMLFLILWGILVIADSPQFSTLVAQTAPAHIKGTALTFVTCIGFAITIASIYFMQFLAESLGRFNNTNLIFLFLAPGPILGLVASYRLIKRSH